MDGSPPNLHRMVSRLVCIKDVLKVKVEVKVHVIWALLGFHKQNKIASFPRQMAGS